MGYWSGHHLNAKMNSDAKVQLNVKVWPVICIPNFTQNMSDIITCKMLLMQYIWMDTWWTDICISMHFSHDHCTSYKKSSWSSHSTGGEWGYTGFILCIHASVHPSVHQCVGCWSLQKKYCLNGLVTWYTHSCPLLKFNLIGKCFCSMVAQIVSVDVFFTLSSIWLMRSSDQIRGTLFPSLGTTYYSRLLDWWWWYMIQSNEQVNIWKLI